MKAVILILALVLIATSYYYVSDLSGSFTEACTNPGNTVTTFKDGKVTCKNNCGEDTRPFNSNQDIIDSCNSLPK